MLPSHRRSGVTEHARRALHFRLTFENDRAIIVIGPGDHTCERWEISRDQLANLVLDAMPRVVK